MGLDCLLRESFTFTYETRLANGLIEHEFVHVLCGTSEENPTLALAEADEWKWIDLSSLREAIKQRPEEFTYWFRICVSQIEAYGEEAAVLAAGELMSGVEG
jgi:isopentenyl-diphosphate delta-isomerase